MTMMMMRRTQTSYLLLFLLVLLDGTGQVPVCFVHGDTVEDWTWDRILSSRKQIVANGNIWPPLPSEKPDDCLILVTWNQLMWHCPSNETNYERTILYRGEGSRFRGAFTAPGTQGRRLWLLDSNFDKDEFCELDTITGEILQSLIINGTKDGHDAVRVGTSVFMVDTRHGHVVECALPASAPPFRESSIAKGAKPVQKEGYVDIIKHHTGFTRADHINNVAVHPELLISNLHGKGALQVASPTRLTALSRTIPQDQGRELDLEQDGFTPVTNVGNWCHGIAFWEEEHDGKSQIKLISLDSKAGTMVSVVLSGPDKGEREVLWEPPQDHPVLLPPEGIAKAYMSGTKVFSKGLAVQGGIAYFGVSFARAPALRQTVPESLLVAYDLQAKKELWVRTIRSNGLIHQVLTQGYLGWKIQLPPELPTEEVTHHGGGGQMVEVCNDDVYDENGRIVYSCKPFEEDEKLCEEDFEAQENCCVCDGGEWSETPLLAGRLDEEVMKIEEEVTATVTFIPTDQCVNANGITKHFSLDFKGEEYLDQMTSIHSDLPAIVRHICNINVQPIQERLMELGDEAFLNAYQAKNGNAIITDRKFIMEEIKPGTASMQFIFSSRELRKVYHFPWLDDWLPMLQDLVLKPLGIPLNKVVRCMFANMPEGSTINFHQDKNAWVQMAHRIHVPIITNPDVFFMTELYIEETDEYETLRIKSNPGEVFEFNNAMAHAVRNLGASRVHMVLDWIDEPLDEEGNTTYELVKLQPGENCGQPTGFEELQCSISGGGIPDMERDEL